MEDLTTIQRYNLYLYVEKHLKDILKGGERPAWTGLCKIINSLLRLDDFEFDINKFPELISKMPRINHQGVVLNPHNPVGYWWNPYTEHQKRLDVIQEILKEMRERKLS